MQNDPPLYHFRQPQQIQQQRNAEFFETSHNDEEQYSGIKLTIESQNKTLARQNKTVREELKDGENFLFFSEVKPELAIKKQVSFDLDDDNEPNTTDNYPRK